MTVISTKVNGKGSGTGTDHHSGWSFIASGETVTVAQNKNMIVYQEIEIQGDLDIEGEVIVII
jgi:hypothetical protein